MPDNERRKLHPAWFLGVLGLGLIVATARKEQPKESYIIDFGSVAAKTASPSRSICGDLERDVNEAIAKASSKGATITGVSFTCR